MKTVLLAVSILAISLTARGTDDAVKRSIATGNATQVQVAENDLKHVLHAPFTYRDSVITIVYDWMSPDQLQDWEVTGDMPSKSGAVIVLPALTVMNHKGVFIDKHSIKGEIAMRNRTGEHLGCGRITVSCRSYNAWFVTLNKDGKSLIEDVYDTGYSSPSDPKKFLKFNLWSVSNGVKLEWDKVLIATPEQIGTGRFMVSGGSGGNFLKAITISGVLDPKWVKAQLDILNSAPLPRSEETSSPATVAVSTNTAPDTSTSNALPTTITIGRDTYEDVRWGNATPSSVNIRHRTGAASIPLAKLPPDLQLRFGYDPNKAAEYRAAERSAEAARDVARQQQWAAQADERQRQANEQAKEQAEKQRQVAEAAAQQRADADAVAKKAAQDFEASLGPVTMIKFDYSTNIETLPNGTCSAYISYVDSMGQDKGSHVEFPAAGLNFMKLTLALTYDDQMLTRNRNARVVYGRPYTDRLHAYWLVGNHLNIQNIPAW